MWNVNLQVSKTHQNWWLYNQICSFLAWPSFFSSEETYLIRQYICCGKNQSTPHNHRRDSRLDENGHIKKCCSLTTDRGRKVTTVSLTFFSSGRSIKWYGAEKKPDNIFLRFCKNSFIKYYRQKIEPMTVREI